MAFNNESHMNTILTTPQHKIIDLKKDFSEDPYGRYPEDGEFNGQRFREEYLLPALQANAHVTVELSNVLCGSSFLEEAFGGLIRYGHYPKKYLDEHLAIKHELPSYVENCAQYMESAVFGESKK